MSFQTIGDDQARPRARQRLEDARSRAQTDTRHENEETEFHENPARGTRYTSKGGSDRAQVADREPGREQASGRTEANGDPSDRNRQPADERAHEDAETEGDEVHLVDRAFDVTEILAESIERGAMPRGM